MTVDPTAALDLVGGCLTCATLERALYRLLRAHLGYQDCFGLLGAADLTATSLKVSPHNTCNWITQLKGDVEQTDIGHQDMALFLGGIPDSWRRFYLTRRVRIADLPDRAGQGLDNFVSFCVRRKG